MATGAVSTAASPPAAASGPLLVRNPQLHLLRRLTFGPTPASLAEIRAMGTTAWLNAQLAPATINDSVCDGYVTRFPRLTKTIPQIRQDTTVSDGTWDYMSDLGQATLLRQMSSRRQLFEVMVDFWSNHLNVTSPSSDVWYCRHDYDKNVIRKYALGRFADMLWASANHPAMLLYLNNAESSPPEFNENYGRELLELHTVGVDAGYTETEMRNSALIMSGFGIHEVWRPDGQPRDPLNGTFEYHPAEHYVGPVSVLGFSDPNASSNGAAMAARYVAYLARHPSTARRIADKLVTRFVSDEPQPTLAAALAQTYQANDTNIVPVLRQLFASKEFLGSVGGKVKRPLEDVLSTLRVLGTTPDPGSGTYGLQALWWETGSLGHQPLAWHLPDGYADVASAWQSTNGTLERWNVHMTVAGQWWIVRVGNPSDVNDPPMLQAPPVSTFLPNPLPATYGAYVNVLSERLLFQRMEAGQRAAILAFLGKTDKQAVKATDAAVTWRLPYVVALILDSAYHAVR
jgi:uncharacterized protein (DUF1800 family)